MGGRTLSEISIFQTGSFDTPQGIVPWQIACEHLKLDDWEALAIMLSEMISPFGLVEAASPGGQAFANSLLKHASTGPLLIVDDVLTTGRTMEKARAGRRSTGAVVFSQGPVVPGWITPIFRMWE